MLLEAKGLTFSYAKGREIFKDLNLSFQTNERLGIVAPSGYGKSTLAKILAGYEKQLAGTITIDGKPVSEKGHNVIQLIYQNPEKAINPRWKMSKVLDEVADISPEIIEKLGIDKSWLARYPNELSGGQLQRFCIARAFGKSTKFIIADEITACLDVITQAEVWQFLLDYINQRDIGLMIITHNRLLASKICSHIINLNN